MKFMDILLEAEGDKPATTTITPEDDGESTDYTAEETPEEPEEDDEGNQTEGEEDEEESTDYTAEEDESNPTEDGEEEPAADDAPEPPAEEEKPEDDAGAGLTEKDHENRNTRRLLNDFISLHTMVKTTVTKLNSIDKSNILINKVVSQITTNLNALQKQLFDFIRFMFRKGKYVTNLYSYNYFLEAFKVNVEMLKKISIFVPNYQNN